MKKFREFLALPFFLVGFTLFFCSLLAVPFYWAVDILYPGCSWFGVADYKRYILKR